MVVETEKHKALVDTGAGNLEPTAGKLLPNLQAAGIVPQDIDLVILTHTHPDHIGGNLDSEGRPAFPNARCVMWELEVDILKRRRSLAATGKMREDRYA